MTDDNENLPARVGRPTKYDERFVTIARMFAADGKTDAEMAYAFGIALSTFYQWKIDYPEFSEAIKEGKNLIDAIIEDALMRRAAGFTKKQIIIKRDKDKKVKEIVEVLDEVPPDTRAIQYWLNNRKRDKWKNKVEITQVDVDLLPDGIEIVDYEPVEKQQQDEPAADDKDQEEGGDSETLS